MIFKFKYKRLGGHVHVDLFAGVNIDALGKNGTIVFREEEWLKFEEAILFRLTPDGVTRVIFQDDTPKEESGEAQSSEGV